MKYFLILVILSTALLSCNKDKKAANKLAGTWNATSLISSSTREPRSNYNIIEEENRTITFEFIACDFETDVDCACHWQTVDFQGYVKDVSYVYSISNKGATLIIDHVDDTFDAIWNITKLTNEAMVMNRTNANGAVLEMKLTKV